MSDQKNIYSALNSVMLELKHLGKDQVNQAQRFNFRGIDDVYNALHPLLAKHGVFTTSRILESNRREAETNKGSKTNWVVLRVEYTFHALDGSSLSTEVEGEAMDSGDKATSKALSMADKYALIQVFKIPTDDTADADKDSFIQERIEASKPRISEEQISKIKAFIKEHSVDELKFLGYLRTNKVESIPLIPAEHFEFFMTALEESKKRVEEWRHNIHRNAQKSSK